jgi:hypothetical protein
MRFLELTYLKIKKNTKLTVVGKIVGDSLVLCEIDGTLLVLCKVDGFLLVSVDSGVEVGGS